MAYFSHRMMNDMKAIFGAVIGLLLKILEIISGACLFLVSPDEETIRFNARLLIFGGYKLAAFVMHLIPCFIGSEITELSAELIHDLYLCEWVNRNPRFQSSMLIIGEVIKNPIKLNVLFYPELTLVALQTVRSCE